jgi:predicted Fe-Mo cluster-binding NifX family protein
MKTVIPVFKNRVSPVFDWCSNLLVVEIQSGREVGRSKVGAADTDPVRQADQVVELGAGMVVCGGIGEILLCLIEASNIRVIPGVSGDIEDVLAALIAGELPHPRFMMPGLGAHMGQHRVRGGFGSNVHQYGRGHRK